MEEFEIWSKASWRSSWLIFSPPASSASVGARPSSCSSFEFAASMSRARERTERGTQSRERSPSMIAPRMRCIAKVSKRISRRGSNRSIASTRPIIP